MHMPETTPYPLGEPFIGTPLVDAPSPRSGRPWFWAGLAVLGIVALMAIGFLVIGFLVIGVAAGVPAAAP